MTPRVTAALALRFVALLILVWALSDLAKLILLLPGGHSVAHASNPIIAPSFDRTPSSEAVLSILWVASPLVVRFVGGLVLFLLSRPLAKLAAVGLE